MLVFTLYYTKFKQCPFTAVSGMSFYTSSLWSEKHISVLLELIYTSI